MRVLVVMDLASKYGGNIMACILDLEARLEANDIEVHFLFPDQARGRSWLTRLDAGRVRFANFSRAPFAREAMRLRRVLGAGTIVYAHFLVFRQIALLRLLFPSVVNHFHMTIGSLPSPTPLKEPLRRFFYRRITTVAVSPAVADDLRARFSLDEGRCRCVPNAVDFVAPRMARRGSLQSDPLFSFVKKDTFVVGIFGTHYERKGVDTAALAFDLLGAPFRLVVLAHDVIDTRAKIDSLSLRRAQIDVHPVIENVGEFYDSIDLFISPSRSEAFCYAVVEAAWSRCLVAASGVPGQDYLRSIPESIWFPPNDPMALAAAVSEARRIADGGRALEIWAEQREYVEKHFSLDVWSSQMLALFRELDSKLA